MNDFVRLVIEIIQYLWPFRKTASYQRGVYRVFGRAIHGKWWFNNPEPGLKLVVPFFTEVEGYLVVPDPLTLPRQSLTVRDGRALVCQALMTVVVEDIYLAIEAVAGYVVSSQEVASGKIATRLMTAEPPELEPDNRGRLLGGLKQSINSDLAKFGCRCTDLTFTQFAFARTYRLFNDSAGIYDA